MTQPTFVSKTIKLVKSNSVEILTAVGVSGVITTSYLAGVAGYKSAEVLRGTELPNDRKERIKEQVRHTWRLYIPTAASGLVTVACVIGASKAGGRKTTAAVAAYSLTEKAFSEYREKVVEEIGKGKEQKIRDTVAQDQVTSNPPSQLIIAGTNGVLCCELYTRRYFRSDMETLRKAQNDINAQIMADLYVTLDEFYDILGLEHTATSGDQGWDSDKLMELVFSSSLTDTGEPCLAFNYNYIKPLD